MMKKISKNLVWIFALALVVVYLLEPLALLWILLGLIIMNYRFVSKSGLAGPLALSTLFMPKTRRSRPMDIPAIDAFLPKEPIQWWYWTGHLQTEDGKRFGFEVVFFSFERVLIMRDQLVHVALTDIDGGSFVFDAFVDSHFPDRTKNGFNLSSGEGNQATAVGGDGKDCLHLEAGNYVLDLDLKQTKPVTQHYASKIHTYIFGGYTYHYSRPCMDASGILCIGGKPHKVTGTGWFDRQYGELYQAITQGWQWFAIELEDGRQIMMFNFNGKNARAENTGTIVDALGGVTTLTADEFEVNILDYWTSPNTGSTYPSGWDVSVKDQKFLVLPLVKDQELHGDSDNIWFGPIYWEGACSVGGDANGKAYVELNGYCDSRQPDEQHQ